MTVMMIILSTQQQTTLKKDNIKEINAMNGQDNIENKFGQLLIAKGNIYWHDLQNTLLNHATVIINSIIVSIIITNKQ